MGEKKKDGKTLLKRIVIFLLVAIVVLALVSPFYPGTPDDWKVKFGDIEVSGKSLGLAFAVLLTFILWKIWPDFRRVVLGLAGAVGKFITNLFK